MRRFFLGTITIITSIITGYTQDIHYSIWDMSPINLNPALTGQFDGDYRINANHRNQWSSVTVPFVTTSFSADTRNLLQQKKWSGGIQLNQDKTGDGSLSTFQSNLSISRMLPFNNDSLQNISIGGQLGFSNKTIDFNPLQFDAQYNGFAFDGNLSNNENFARSSIAFLNSNIGIAYFNQIEDRKKVSLGIGIFNLNTGRQSFNNDVNIQLDLRTVLHGEAEWELNDKWDLLPSFIHSSQGKYREFMFGSGTRYIITDFIGMYRAVWGGLYYRNRDALFFNLGLNYDQWKVGLNYDLNTSTLKPASNGRGGIEVAIEYIIKLSKPTKTFHKVCPDYL